MEKQKSPKGFLMALPAWDCCAWSAWQFFQVKDRKGNYRDIPGNWAQYAGYFPLWRLSCRIILCIRMKFEQNGRGFQNLYNIPPGMEVPWLTYQQFSNLIGNVTDMVVAEKEWQPMIDAIWEADSPDTRCPGCLASLRCVPGAAPLGRLAAIPAGFVIGAIC